MPWEETQYTETKEQKEAKEKDQKQHLKKLKMKAALDKANKAARQKRYKILARKRGPSWYQKQGLPVPKWLLAKAPVFEQSSDTEEEKEFAVKGTQTEMTFGGNVYRQTQNGGIGFLEKRKF